MTVGTLCAKQVDTARVDESVQTAADRMNARNVGSLVVLDAAGQPMGIVTDRDLAVRVLAKGLDAYQTTVRDVMTVCPKTIHQDLPVEQALSIMRSGPFRRLAVVDGDGRLVGLLSVDDILDRLADEFRQIGELLRAEGPATLARR